MTEHSTEIENKAIEHKGKGQRFLEHASKCFTQVPIHPHDSVKITSSSPF